MDNKNAFIDCLNQQDHDHPMIYNIIRPHRVQTLVLLRLRELARELSTRGPYGCTMEQVLPSRLLSSGCSSKQWTAIRADDTHDCTGMSLWNQRGKIADPFRCDCRVEGREARGNRLHWPHKRRLLRSVCRERKKQQTAS